MRLGWLLSYVPVSALTGQLVALHSVSYIEIGDNRMRFRKRTTIVAN